MRRRRGLTIRLGGGSAVRTHGDSMVSRTPVANICKNSIDLEQQALIITIGSLLLKRWRVTMNSLVMAMQLGGKVQGPSEGTTLPLRQRNISNRINRIHRRNRMLTPCQLQKPIATK